MSTPWPSAATSTAAQPCGTCPRCGGQLYAYLYHACTTTTAAIKLTLPYRDLSPLGGGPKP